MIRVLSTSLLSHNHNFICICMSKVEYVTLQDNFGEYLLSLMLSQVVVLSTASSLPFVSSPFDAVVKTNSKSWRNDHNNNQRVEVYLSWWPDIIWGEKALKKERGSLFFQSKWHKRKEIFEKQNLRSVVFLMKTKKKSPLRDDDCCDWADSPDNHYIPQNNILVTFSDKKKYKDDFFRESLCFC